MNHYRVREGLLHEILARRLLPQEQLYINQIRTWKSLLTRPKSGLRNVEFARVTNIKFGFLPIRGLVKSPQMYMFKNSLAELNL